MPDSDWLDLLLENATTYAKIRRRLASVRLAVLFLAGTLMVVAVGAGSQPFALLALFITVAVAPDRGWWWLARRQARRALAASVTAE